MKRLASPSERLGVLCAVHDRRLAACEGVHYAPKNDVKLPPQLPDGGDLRRGGDPPGGPPAGPRRPPPTHPATTAEVHCIRKRSRPCRRGMVAEPDPLLRLRPALRHV